MKLRNLYKIIFATLVAIGCASCDDFLTQENPNAELYSEYYESVDDCDTGLTGVYNGLTSSDIWLLYQDMMRADMGIQGGNNTNRSAFSNQYYLHSYGDSDSSVADRWAAIYIVIRRANDLIAGIEKVRETTTTTALNERLDYIESQTYFMRGLMYFYLTISYRHKYDNDFDADECVPLHREMITDIDTFAKPCSTTNEVRDAYREDLLHALDLGLPTKWEESSDTGRVTLGTIQTVLGMSYLFEASEPNQYFGSSEDCYREAAKYFKAVIDSGAFQLAQVGSSDQSTNYNFTTAGEFNCESILEVSYTLTDNVQLTGYSKLYHTWGMNFTTKGGYYTCVPSLWLVNEFEGETPDPLNPVNIIELEKDEFYGCYNGTTQIQDVIYTQLGEPCIKDHYTSPTYPAYKVAESIVHRYSGLADDGVTKVFYDNIYLRTITYNPAITDPDDRIVSVAYSTNLPLGTRRYMADSKSTSVVETNQLLNYWEDDGKLYRTRLFSPRASYSMAINGDIDLDHYGDLTPASGGTFKTAVGGIFRKLCNWDIRTDEGDSVPANTSGVNYRVIRLSHVYLMYAEALIQGGQESGSLNEAISYVNKVRYRAGATLIGSKTQTAEYSESATFDGDKAVPHYQAATGSMSAVELMKHLMYVERPLEMSQEGFHTRIADLRRWRDPENWDVSTYNVTGDRLKDLATSDDYKYYFVVFYYLQTSTSTGAWTKGTNWYKQVRYNKGEEEEIYATDDDETFYNDYAQANIVYNGAGTGTGDWYWPIPSGEKIANPYIN